MSPKPAVLFVCLGNICRSPLAEAAFRQAAETFGLKAEADSAGTAAYHVGGPPDPRSIATAAAHGIDIRQYRARQITDADFSRFTHILALDRENLFNIGNLKPESNNTHIGLLMDFVPGRMGEEVADPYYGNAEGFKKTWRDVSEAAKALVKHLSH